ncbi:MAG: rod shape-determining protein MreD [Betaproteobacteria bacterium]|nr:rod shape-determining protein MreD [Betaproteobacteria bacterium]
MPLDTPRQQELLAPVKLRYVVISLFVALIFILLPWRDLRGVPDLVALVIVFWAIHQPRQVGMGAAFLAGLLVDAANAVLFGQHALAYAFLAFAAYALHRRMLWFGPWPQALHVLLLLLVAQLLMVMVRMYAGSAFPGWSYFLGSVIAAALWPLATLVLLAPQRLAASKNEPI